MPGADLEIRPFTDEELPAALHVLATAFSDSFTDADVEAERSVAEPARSQAAFDGDDLVGCLGCYTFDVSVPGGSVPAAGTTLVGVLPTHRRQGILARMMAGHLRDVDDRGEPIAMLWASEAAIYGRWGYGVAVEAMSIRLAADGGLTWAATAPPPADRVRFVPIEDAADVLQPIYEAARRRRGGMHARWPEWWRFQLLTTRPGVMFGDNDRRVAVAEIDGHDVAYVIYGGKEVWGDDGRPRSTLTVSEMTGVDGAAEAAMWRFLAGHDLVTEVIARRRPVDDALPLLLTDPRRAVRRVTDALHVRVMDVQAALTGRTYAASVGATIEVIDPIIGANDGVWRIEVAPEGSLVEPSSDAPDLRMPITTLGSLYLGGMSAQRLAAAGLLEAPNTDALAALDVAFRASEAPWGPEVW